MSRKLRASANIPVPRSGQQCPPSPASEIVSCPRCCLQGHQAGLEAFKATVTLCHDWGIQALTVCAGKGGGPRDEGPSFKTTMTLCHDWGIQALTVCAGKGGGPRDEGPSFKATVTLCHDWGDTSTHIVHGEGRGSGRGEDRPLAPKP